MSSTDGNRDPSSPAGVGGPTETVRAPAVPRLGGRLGRYELMEVVGHGAMATVFKARDTQLGREVAVKVMSLAVAARAESAERFRREAQAVAAVKHPGIVEIFDFVGASQGEPAYIVSELICGPTLRQFLDARRGRLLPESAALIAIPIAEALRVAHARGIVHRDIKPDNVMLDRSGGKSRVVVTDFGVAHITGMETMTATGALVGSPAFMSPEQARGHGVGPASDLWALGVLLYEMATGHLPFPGKDALLVVAAIARGLYKRPSLVSPYVGSGLDEICGRCLRLAPEERYPDLAVLASDLRTFCRAGGLEPDEASLFLLLTDPERFEAGLRPKVADTAVAQARRHSRRGELGRALSELARATAYVPKHAEAEKLVASISWRRRWFKVAGVAAAAAAVAGAVVFLTPRVRGWIERTRQPAVVAAPPAGAAPAAGVPAERPQLPPLTPEPPALAGAPSASGALAVPPAHGALAPRGAKRRADRGRARSGQHRNVARAEPVAAQPEPEPAGALEVEAPEAEVPSVSDPAAVTTAPPPPRRVDVEIYSQRGHCTPALDNPVRAPVQGSAVSPAKYLGSDAVTEGPHEVFCTSTGGATVSLGKVQVAAPPQGGVLRFYIGRDKHGRPLKPVPVPAGATGLRQPDPGRGGNPAAGQPGPR